MTEEEQALKRQRRRQNAALLVAVGGFGLVGIGMATHKEDSLGEPTPNVTTAEPPKAPR